MSAFTTQIHELSVLDREIQKLSLEIGEGRLDGSGIRESEADHLIAPSDDASSLRAFRQGFEIKDAEILLAQKRMRFATLHSEIRALLKLEIDITKNRINARTSENERIHAQNSEMETAIAQVKMDSAYFEGENSTLKSRSETLRDALNIQQGKLSDLRIQAEQTQVSVKNKAILLSDKEASLTKSRAMRDKLKLDEAKATEQLETVLCASRLLESDIEARNDELRSIGNKRAELETEVYELDFEWKALCHHHSSQESMKNALQAEVLLLNNELRAKQRMHETNTVTLARLQNDLEDVLSKLEMKERELLESNQSLAELQKEHNRLLAENERAITNDEAGSYNEKRCQLSQVEEQMGQATLTRRDLMKSLQKLRSENHILKQNQQRMAEKIKDTCDSIIVCEMETKRLRDASTEEEFTNASLKEMVKALRKQRHELAQNLKQENGVLAKLQQQETVAREAVKDMKIELENRLRENDDSGKAIILANQSLSAAGMQKNELYERAREITGRIEANVNEIDKLRFWKDGAEKTKAGLETRAGELRSDLARVGKELSTNLASLDTIRGEMSLAEEQLRIQEMRLISLDDELRHKNLEFSNAEHELNLVKRQLPVVKSLSCELEASEEELKRLKAQRSKLENSLDHVRGEQIRVLYGADESIFVEERTNDVKARLLDRKERLIECKIISAELDAQIQKLKSSTGEKTELITQLNSAKYKMHKLTKTLTARIAELSAVSSKKTVAEHELHRLTMALAEAHENVKRGLPPSVEAESTYKRELKLHEARKELMKRRSEGMTEMIKILESGQLSQSHAIQRDHTYIPPDSLLPIPQPFPGCGQPFNPTEVGTTFSKFFRNSN